MSDLLVSERTKYEKIWKLASYTAESPGKTLVPMFMEISGCKKGDSLIDLGCGDGQGGKALSRRGAKVTYLDFVRIGKLKPFIEQPLWHPIRVNGAGWDYGYCCDVMEHIPPEFTMLVVQNILRACKSVFFSVSFIPDNFGKFVGEPLHLTVRPYVWWRDRLAMMGGLVEARDCLGEGIFHVKSRHGGWAT